MILIKDSNDMVAIDARPQPTMRNEIQIFAPILWRMRFEGNPQSE